MKTLFLLPVALLLACNHGNSSGGDADGDRMPELFPEVEGFDGAEDPGGEDPDQGEAVDPDAAEEFRPESIAHLDVEDPQELDLAPIAPSRPAMPCGEGCRQVSFADASVWGPNVEVWGNYLVLNTFDNHVTKKVWLVDLGNLDHYVLSETHLSDPGMPGNLWVDIYESDIVFGFVTNDSNIYHYSLMRFNLSTNLLWVTWEREYESAGPTDTDLFGDLLSWWDGRIPEGYGGQVFLYNMRTGEERLLSPDGCCATYTQMFGDHVIWCQGVPAYGQQIWLHDIRTGESRQITTGPKDKFGPTVSEDKAAWAECIVDNCDAFTGESSDIVMLDLITGETVHVTSDLYAQGLPVVWGNIVAWSDFRNDPTSPHLPRTATESDIYYKDLSTGEERQLTSVSGAENAIAIFENKLYFFKLDLQDIKSVFEVEIP